MRIAAASSSNGPKFEAPSSLFKTSSANPNINRNDGTKYTFGRSYAPIPKEQEGLSWEGFNRNDVSLPMDSKKDKPLNEMNRAVETPTSRIFGFGDYKNNENKHNSILTGTGAPSRPLFAVTTPNSSNPFKGFRGEGIGGGLAGQPETCTVPSKPLIGVNPFVISSIKNPFQGFRLSEGGVAGQPPKAVPAKTTSAVTPTSSNPFRSSFTGQPNNEQFLNHGIRPESSAITPASHPAITVSNPWPAPAQATVAAAKSTTIGGVGSWFPHGGISIGVPGKSIQPTILTVNPAKPIVPPSSERFFISPPKSNNTPPAVSYFNNNKNSTQLFQYSGVQQSSSTIEIAAPKNSFLTPQFHYPPAMMTVPVPVSVSAPASAPLSTSIVPNPGASTIAIANNSLAVGGPVQPHPQQRVVQTESKSQPQDLSHKIEILMKQYEELISSPQETYSKPAEEVPKELVNASATFIGFSGSSVHFLPDTFTHRACTARVVPRGIRVSTDSRPPSTPLASRTVKKPLNNYTLESLSSPDLLYHLGRNAKKMVIVSQSAVPHKAEEDDDATDITAGLPARTTCTMTATTVPADPVAPNPPSLTLEGYWTSPDMSILKNLSDSELSKVENFAICRDKYGKIEWNGTTDVRGLDLDKLVRIDKKEVFVYGDDCDDNSGGLHAPPPVGTALNKRAVITLWEVFPKSSRGGDESDDGKKFEEKLHKFCIANDADHISYSVATGAWVFAVKHF